MRQRCCSNWYPDHLAGGLPATTSSIPIHPSTQPCPSLTGSPPYLPIISSTQMASTSAPAPQTSLPGQPASITPGLPATTSCHPIYPSTQPPPSSTGSPPRPPILSSFQPPSTSIQSSASSSPSHLPPPRNLPPHLRTHFHPCRLSFE